MEVTLKDGSTYYTGTTDSAFKAIFCNPKNEDLLISLLETVLKTKIEIIKIIPPENLKQHISERSKTLDVIVQTDNKIINVELNSCLYPDLHRRNAAFIFQRYSSDAKKGNSYDDMNNIIQVNLAEKMSLKDEEVGIYKLTDKNTGKNFIDNLTIYEFNLSKIKNMCYNGKNREYKLLAAICSDKDELKSLCEGDKTMEKYENEINKLNDDEKFCNFMSQEKEAEMLQNTLIHYAENDGLQKGLTKKAKEIALKMLSKGKDIKEISELTGLPIETIEKLK